MLEIYFNGILLDQKYYQSLIQKWVMFDKEFKLGITMARQFILVIPKSQFDKDKNNIFIRYKDEDYAHLILDNYKIIEGGTEPSVELTLVDKMVNANFRYDAEPLTPCTVKEILQDIADKMDVELGTNSFINDDVIVDYWNNTIQAREYLSYIAELNGGFARIENDGKLYLRKFDEIPQKEIDVKYCEKVNIGEEHKIERVVFDNGSLYFETSDNTQLETVYLNPNNLFLTTAEQFNKLATNILDFTFINLNTGRAKIIDNALVGDSLKLTYKYNDYNTICQFKELFYNKGWHGGYDLNVNSSIQQETIVLGTADKIKQVNTILDRNNATLIHLAEEVDDNTGFRTSFTLSPTQIELEVGKIEGLDDDINDETGLKKSISKLKLDIDKLRSEIGDVTDITQVKEGVGTLSFENVNASEPINVEIRPTQLEDIAYIYPRTNLYPSTTLYPKIRMLRFKNTTTNENFDYVLPGDLYYYDEDNYDIFTLNYAEQVCQIIRMVNINATGVKTKKASPVTENYDYPFIHLPDGNYEVSLLGYPQGWMQVRLMSQNMYTSQFATRVELSSAITQSANTINLEVVKKVGKTEVISSINQTAEAIKIQAGKIDIKGTITAINSEGTTTINGNKITSGTITATQIAANTITANQVASSVITTNNFSSQSINAGNITSGTLSSNRLSANVITTSNLSAQNISADQITTGTLSANRISGGSLTASSITGNSSINITRGSYSFTMGVTSNHPSASGLNVGFGGIVTTGGGLTLKRTSSSGSSYNSGSRETSIVFQQSNGQTLISGKTKAVSMTYLTSIPSSRQTTTLYFRNGILVDSSQG